MKCDCLNEINAKLEAKNLRLCGYTFSFPDMTPIPFISTEWIRRDDAPKGKKNSPNYMLASHCPFCGVEIETPHA